LPLHACERQPVPPFPLIRSEQACLGHSEAVRGNPARGVAGFAPESNHNLDFLMKDLTMRLHAQTAVIENGFVLIPETAPWLVEYLHELTICASS